jgi:type 1 fimbria pilin
MNIFFLSIFTLLIFNPKNAGATISGVHGIQYQKNSQTMCPTNGLSGIGLGTGGNFKGNACSLNPPGGMYVPKSGNYKVRLYIYTKGTKPWMYAESTSGYFDATKELATQNVALSGSDKPLDPYQSQYIDYCYTMVDDQGNEFAPGDCGGAAPLPPDPPAPPTSCTINGSNALNVNLDTVERSALPTSADYSSMTSYSIPVVCTGGVDVSVTFKLNYTPITMNGTESVKSTSNGLGVAIGYDNKILATTDVTPVTFISGSNELDLNFQAVRDPAVALEDIPTGSFSASAVLVMTQQ